MSYGMFSNANHQELVTINQLISELEACFPYQEYMMAEGWFSLVINDRMTLNPSLVDI
jgi:hypothetical protein